METWIVIVALVSTAVASFLIGTLFGGANIADDDTKAPVKGTGFDGNMDLDTQIVITNPESAKQIAEEIIEAHSIVESYAAKAKKALAKYRPKPGEPTKKTPKNMTKTSGGDYLDIERDAKHNGKTAKA